jgi:uncharacterized repeat protein (TIGR03803 family)
MKKVLRFRVAACAIFSFFIATAIATSAQTLTTLVSFDGLDGSGPAYETLTQGFDGDFYGTTTVGGTSGNCVPGCGTVFKITSAGLLTTLHSFNLSDGAYPLAGLTLTSDGDFYGTTEEGGANCTVSGGCGTVFKMSPSGVLTTLYSFCTQTNCMDGYYPVGGLVEGSDGSFYGTTYSFGGPSPLYGTVFKTTSAGLLTTLHSFDLTDGAYPLAGLIQATDGDFYGTTEYGGVLGYGTAFRINTSGIFTTLYSFCSQSQCDDGTRPLAALVQAGNGDFYGTTEFGGATGNGTIFKITSAGALSTLYSFCIKVSCSDGNQPLSALTRATDGNFYGSTQYGGAGNACESNCGTVFKMTPEGALTTVHSFDLNDGASPYGGLLQSTDGNFYGTTFSGGSNGDGTVFSLSVGLGPFVEALPPVGKAGSRIVILGNALTGTTSVTFNGTPATFTAVSPTEIKTTVPTGATSGKVQVTTPHGTLTSNVVFHVK